MSKKQQQQEQQQLQQICRQVLQNRRHGEFDWQTVIDALPKSERLDPHSKGGRVTSAVSSKYRHLERAIKVEFQYEGMQRNLRNRLPESRSADWSLAIVSDLWPIVSSATTEDDELMQQFSESKGDGGNVASENKLDGVALYWRARLFFEYWKRMDREKRQSNMASLKRGVNWCDQCVQESNEKSDSLTKLEPWRAIPVLARVLKAQIYLAMEDETQAMEVYHALYDSMLQLNENGTAIVSTFSQSDSLVMIAAQSALLYYPEMLLSKGKIDDCITALRNLFGKRLILHAEVQFSIIRQLGSVLMNHADAIQYVPLKPPAQKSTAKKGTSSAVSGSSSSKSQSPVVPQSATEEALLVFLVLQQLVESTSMAFKVETLSKHKIAEIYDNICLLLSADHQYQSLLYTLERGMAHFYEDAHFWNQYALALINAKKHTSALGVLQECMSLQPNNIVPILSAVKIYLNHIPHDTDKLNECMRLAQTAMDKGRENPFFAHRCHHAMAQAFTALSRHSNSQTERQTYQSNALKHLTRAHELDSRDHVVCYHLALQYAEIREIPKAFSFAKRSIEMYGHLVDAWILLALLFTCTKDYANAFKTVRVARKKFPSNLRVMILNARLEEVVEGDRHSIRTYTKLRDYVCNTYLGGLFRSENDDVDNDNGNEVAENGQANGIASGGNNDANGVSSPSAKNAPRTNITQFKILSKKHKLFKRRDKAANAYMVIADAFKRFSVYDEATNTVKLAQDLLSLSETFVQDSEDVQQMIWSSKKAYIDSRIHFCEGQINEATKRINEAISEYEHALLLDNNNKHATLRLGIISYQQQKKNAVARSLLHQAVRIDPCFYAAWHHLGLVLKDMGEYKEASDCLFTALQLEQSTPLMPFESLLRNKL